MPIATLPLTIAVPLLVWVKAHKQCSHVAIAGESVVVSDKTGVVLSFVDWNELISWLGY